MIELALLAQLTAPPSPYDWQMSCAQVAEALQTLDQDPWFSRSENQQHKANVRRKLIAHGPPHCIPLSV